MGDTGGGELKATGDALGGLCAMIDGGFDGDFSEGD